MNRKNVARSIKVVINRFVWVLETNEEVTLTYHISYYTPIAQ